MNTAQFYDLTYLYPEYRWSRYIKRDDWKWYSSLIKENIKNFNTGDILFIGSSYESRQYYGFARILRNEDYSTFQDGFESIEEVFLPDINYSKAIEQLEEFYRKKSEKLFYSDFIFSETHSELIERLKEKGQI